MIKRFFGELCRNGKIDDAGKSLSYLIGTLILLILAICPAQGQFLRLTLDVETEHGARDVNNLSFGVMAPGTHELNLGDDGIGVYSLSGYPNNFLNVSIQPPEYLQHTDPGIADRLIIEVASAYANQGENNRRDAISMVDNRGRFPVRSEKSAKADRRPVLELCWLYIYGTIHIGNTAAGLYEGEVIIKIEYE